MRWAGANAFPKSKEKASRWPTQAHMLEFCPGLARQVCVEIVAPPPASAASTPAHRADYLAQGHRHGEK